MMLFPLAACISCEHASCMPTQDIASFVNGSPEEAMSADGYLTEEQYVKGVCT